MKTSKVFRLTYVLFAHLTFYSHAESYYEIEYENLQATSDSYYSDRQLDYPDAAGGQLSLKRDSSTIPQWVFILFLISSLAFLGVVLYVAATQVLQKVRRRVVKDYDEESSAWSSYSDAVQETSENSSFNSLHEAEDNNILREIRDSGKQKKRSKKEVGFAGESKISKAKLSVVSLVKEAPSVVSVAKSVKSATSAYSAAKSSHSVVVSRSKIWDIWNSIYSAK